MRVEGRGVQAALPTDMCIVQGREAPTSVMSPDS